MQDITKPTGCFTAAYRPQGTCSLDFSIENYLFPHTRRHLETCMCSSVCGTCVLSVRRLTRQLVMATAISALGGRCGYHRVTLPEDYGGLARNVGVHHAEGRKRGTE